MGIAASSAGLIQMPLVVAVVVGRVVVVKVFLLTFHKFKNIDPATARPKARATVTETTTLVGILVLTRSLG